MNKIFFEIKKQHSHSTNLKEHKNMFFKGLCHLIYCLNEEIYFPC